MCYTFVLQLALKPIVYQYVTDIQGEFWSLVGPEGLELYVFSVYFQIFENL